MSFKRKIILSMLLVMIVVSAIPVFANNVDSDVNGEKFILTNDALKPVLNEVEVIDERTILIKYSEKLKTTGLYKLSYEDDNHDEALIDYTNMTVLFENEEIRDTVKIELAGDTVLLDQEYKLVIVISPRDFSNNKMVDQDIERVFIGISNNVTLALETLKKTSENTLEAVFNEPIQIRKHDGTSSIQPVVYIPYDNQNSDEVIDGYMAFLVDLIDDRTLLFTKQSGSLPKELVELKFNFARLSVNEGAIDSDEDIQVIDQFSRVITDQVYLLEVENNDHVPPTLNQIQVIDERTILLDYSEKLKTTGLYKLSYIDDSNNEVTIDYSNMTVLFKDEGIRDIVRIELNEDIALLDKEYKLMIVISPRDITNNKMIDQNIERFFMGVSAN